jgi:hypothetical protein
LGFSCHGIWPGTNPGRDVRQIGLVLNADRDALFEVAEPRELPLRELAGVIFDKTNGVFDRALPLVMIQ